MLERRGSSELSGLIPQEVREAYSKGEPLCASPAGTAALWLDARAVERSLGARVPPYANEKSEIQRVREALSAEQKKGIMPFMPPSSAAKPPKSTR